VALNYRYSARPKLSWSSPWTWLVPICAVLAAIGVLLGPGNHPLFLTLNASAASAGPSFWSNVTVLGDTVVALAILLPFAARRPEIAWTALLAGVFATLWVHGLKWPIGSPRPGLVLAQGSFNLIGPLLGSSPSFPSGHATTAVTVAAVIAMHFRQAGMTIALTAIAILVAYSRIAVGVHWPLDVLAGVFGGWLSAVLGYRLAQQMVWGQTERGHNWAVTVLFVPPIVLVFGYNAGYPNGAVFTWLIGAVTLILGIIGRRSLQSG